jgi:hypothetical protein
MHNNITYSTNCKSEQLQHYRPWKYGLLLIAPRTLKVNDVRLEVVTAVLMKIYDCVGMYVGVWVRAFWRSKRSGLSCSFRQQGSA